MNVLLNKWGQTETKLVINMDEIDQRLTKYRGGMAVKSNMGNTHK